MYTFNHKQILLTIFKFVIPSQVLLTDIVSTELKLERNATFGMPKFYISYWYLSTLINP